MKVVQTKAEIGADRVLHLVLPEDAPTGLVEVLVILGTSRSEPTLEARRAAARAGRGVLRAVDISSEALLAERQADEERRERALGG